MATVKTKMYAQIDRDSAYIKGVALGLTGEALKRFSYFNEVCLIIEVDIDGMVQNVKADWNAYEGLLEKQEDQEIWNGMIFQKKHCQKRIRQF